MAFITTYIKVESSKLDKKSLRLALPSSRFKIVDKFDRPELFAAYVVICDKKPYLKGGRYELFHLVYDKPRHKKSTKRVRYIKGMRLPEIIQDILNIEKDVAERRERFKLLENFYIIASAVFIAPRAKMMMTPRRKNSKRRLNKKEELILRHFIGRNIVTNVELRKSLRAAKFATRMPIGDLRAKLKVMRVELITTNLSIELRPIPLKYKKKKREKEVITGLIPFLTQTGKILDMRKTNAIYKWLGEIENE